MTDQNVQQLVEEIKRKFGGRDPIAELGAFVAQASREELQKMVMLSTNKIGEALCTTGTYETPYQAAMGVNLGADLLLASYKFAVCQNKMMISPIFGNS